MEIRKLRARDDRSLFRSGDADLDRFFAKYAGQNQFRHHIGTTYVAMEAGRIAGFFTVTPGQIESEDLAPSLGRRLPRYPLPILRLARLAVDESCRGRGVGRELIGAVFELALRMAAELGCVGIAVDAKQEAVAFYAKFGFSPMTILRGQMRGSPKPTPMFISLARLESASRPQ